MNHRDFLFDVAWRLMDFRQTVEFEHLFSAEDIPMETVIGFLGDLQLELTEYADEQLKKGLEGWEVPKGDF